MKSCGSPLSFSGQDDAFANLLDDPDRRIVVTGASGWLGLATLESLHTHLGDSFSRRVSCFGSTARRLKLRGDLAVDQQALPALANLAARPALVFHYACLTRDKVGGQPLNDYVEANRRISSFIEEQLIRIGVDRLFMPSSGAVYNTDRSLSTDLQSNPYGVLKLEDERRFARWAETRKALAVVPRIFNLSGPYINKTQTYVLASLILDALADRPMRISATRPVIRSYTGIRQLVSTCVGLLANAGGAGAFANFDTAGETEVEIGELALRVNRALDCEVPIERGEVDPSFPNRYVGDGAWYTAASARSGVEIDPLDIQIRETAAYLGPAAAGGR